VSNCVYYSAQHQASFTYHSVQFRRHPTLILIVDNKVVEVRPVQFLSMPHEWIESFGAERDHVLASSAAHLDRARPSAGWSDGH